MPKVSPVVEFQ